MVLLLQVVEWVGIRQDGIIVVGGRMGGNQTRWYYCCRWQNGWELDKMVLLLQVVEWEGIRQDGIIVVGGRMEGFRQDGIIVVGGRMGGNQTRWYYC